MGIVQKQGISIAFVSFVGVVIGAINTMFVFPNVLGAERHGLVMLILSLATVIAPTNGLLVEGSFGLGTNDPKSKLDVEGGAVIGATYSLSLIHI